MYRHKIKILESVSSYYDSYSDSLSLTSLAQDTVWTGVTTYNELMKIRVHHNRHVCQCEQEEICKLWTNVDQ